MRLPRGHQFGEVVGLNFVFRVLLVILLDKLLTLFVVFQDVSSTADFLRYRVDIDTNWNVYSEAHNGVQSGPSCQNYFCVATSREHGQKWELRFTVVAFDHSGCHHMRLYMVYWNHRDVELVAQSFGEVYPDCQTRFLPGSNRDSYCLQI